MTQTSVAGPVEKRSVTSLRWLPGVRWRAVLSRADRLAGPTAVGVLIGLVLGGALAWFVNDRFETLIGEQVSAAAADDVALGMTSLVTASDFDAPDGVAVRDDLRSRLTPVIDQVHSNGSEVIGVQLVAREGTLIYTDAATDVGKPLPAAERPLLAAALAGQHGSMASSPVDAGLQSLFSHVLFVAVPVERDGSIVGAYIVQRDLHVLDSLGRLVWAVVAIGFALTFHVALRTLAATSDRQSTGEPERRAVTPRAGTACTVPPAQQLTRRELEVLRLLATTLTYEQIAWQLSISQETVRTHVKGVFNKLGQPNRTQAVLVALKSGLLQRL